MEKVSMNQILGILVKASGSSQLMEELSEAINILHPTNQQSMGRVILSMIVQIGGMKEANRYDIRNEKIVDICKKIANLLETENVLIKDGNKKRVSLPLF
jgi:hypothetical protein